MTIDEALLETFGRVAKKQHLARIDELTQKIEELSSIEGIDLLKKYPLQFNPGSDQWEKCLYFLLLLFGGNSKTPVFMSISWSHDKFTVFAQYEDKSSLKKTLSPEDLLRNWRQARPLKASDVPVSNPPQSLRIEPSYRPPEVPRKAR